LGKLRRKLGAGGLAFDSRRINAPAAVCHKPLTDTSIKQLLHSVLRPSATQAQTTLLRLVVLDIHCTTSYHQLI